MFEISLFNETTFYETFLGDLQHCQNELIIESPFITIERMGTFWSAFNKLLKDEVKIYVMTRDPKEHNAKYAQQSELVF